MELLLVRKWLKDKYTIGHLSVNGQPFSDTLEDRVRDLEAEPKVPGQTAIPEGEYRVIMSFSKRFQRIMPEVLNVPYFTAIRIHGGVTDANTEGCPLVGKNDVVGELSRGRYYSDLLNQKIMESYNLEKIWLKVVRGAI